LEFTDFFSSPYDLLVETYETKKSGMSALHRNNEGETDLVTLEERFQSDFQGALLKVGVVVDKLSTYLSEDR
jgi:hypothetical protein